MERPKLQESAIKRAWIISGIAVTALVAIALALHISSPFFATILDGCSRSYHVPTAAMEPSVMTGDRIRANTCAYNAESPPQVGDIIVFQYPRDPRISYVKRVVGIGGDRLQMIDRVLHRNGEPVPRELVKDQAPILASIGDQPEMKTLYRETLGDRMHFMMNNKNPNLFVASNWPPDGTAMTIPEGQVYVMGDNRDNSSDSRVWGGVPLDLVVGRVEYVFWSTSDKGVRWERFFEPIDTWGL